MDRSEELRGFLRSRRARLEPADVGLGWEAIGRRTPGLRREELAVIAGISTDYYARLEQGRARNVSDQVVDALAKALQLDSIERAHLRRLTRADAKPSPRPQTRAASAEITSMIEALAPTPALVHNSMLDVFAANTMADVLLEGLLDPPPGHRNLARWLFLQPESRRVFLDWEVSARDMASTLRMAATQSGDAAVQPLIGELTAGSTEFAAYWTEHRISGPGAFTKRIRHEAVGEFELSYQSLAIPQANDQYVALYTPEPGSPSAEKLARLASWAANRTTPPPPPSPPP